MINDIEIYYLTHLGDSAESTIKACLVMRFGKRLGDAQTQERAIKWPSGDSSRPLTP